MSRKATAALTSLGLVAGLAAAGSVLYARDTRYRLEPMTERFMYLTSDRTARRVTLSFRALAADVYWIRAIQHYGRDAKSLRTTDRFELLHPLLQLTTTLDPYFTIAYRFGAVFLAMPPADGPGRPDQAIALLQKGLTHNPHRWQFAMDIGFIHYWYTGDMPTAAASFEQAAALPGAPDWLRPLAAMTLLQGGNRAGARSLLAELQKSEEEYIRHAAERALLQLEVMDQIDGLQALIDKYHQAHPGPIPSWIDMVRANVMPVLLVDPAGVPLEYDPATGRLNLSPTSPVGPLPQTLKQATGR